MVNRDFERVLRVLHDEFGDVAVDFVAKQGVEFMRNQIVPGASAMKPRIDEPMAGSHQPAEKEPMNSNDGAAAAGTENNSGGQARGDATTGSTIYDDAEGFETAVGNHMENLAGAAIQNPADVVAVVEDMVHVAAEVRKFEEAQITQRMAIAADRDVAVARIKAQQELLRDYLDRSFDERAENFSRLFAVVDGALETNNMQALAMGLDSVVKLADSSPFKDLRSIEETATALTDPDHEWDF